MFLLFNMLSRFVITFIPRSKHLLISLLQSPSTVILDPPKSSLSLFPLFPHLFAKKWWRSNECQRIDAFELWCWRRRLRVPWTARRSNQSILEEISPRCSIEGLRLKLKLQYFGCLMWRVDSLEKILILGGIGGRRKGTTEDEMDGINDSMDLSLSKLWEFVIHKEAWNAVIHGVTKSWTQLSDWT